MNGNCWSGDNCHLGSHSKGIMTQAEKDAQSTRDKASNALVAAKSAKSGSESDGPTVSKTEKTTNQ